MLACTKSGVQSLVLCLKTIHSQTRTKERVGERYAKGRGLSTVLVKISWLDSHNHPVLAGEWLFTGLQGQSSLPGSCEFKRHVRSQDYIWAAKHACQPCQARRRQWRRLHHPTPTLLICYLILASRNCLCSALLCPYCLKQNMEGGRQSGTFTKWIATLCNWVHLSVLEFFFLKQKGPSLVLNIFIFSSKTSTTSLSRNL